MKFTIGQRVRFYVSREFLEGQNIASICSPGWVTGKVTKLCPQENSRPVKVTLDPETNIFSTFATFSLHFTEKGHYYTNTEVIEEAEQLTLRPLTVLKRRHL